MTVLATATDVAKSLGFSNADALSDSQKERVTGELARVTAAWVRAAGRSWTPGPVRVQTVVVGGWVTLPDLPADDPVVTTRDGDPVDVLVNDGDQLKTGHVTGTILNIDYTAPAVPLGVSYAVAGIVARRLGIEPGSPETRFTEITAGADFRAKGAAWVASTRILTEDEEAEARAYRPGAGTAIFARWR